MKREGNGGWKGERGKGEGVRGGMGKGWEKGEGVRGGKGKG